MHPGDDREGDVHLAILDRLEQRPIARRPRSRRRRAVVALARRRTRTLRRAVRAGLSRARSAVRSRADRLAEEAARAARVAAHRAAYRGGAAIRGARHTFARGMEAGGQTVRAVLARRAAALTVALSAGRTAARRGLRPAAYASGAVILVLLAALGWRDALSLSAVHERSTKSRPSPPTVRAELTPGRSEGGARLEAAATALHDTATPEPRKLAIVEQLTDDAGDAATGVLLSAIDSPSLVVSMAGIRALRGRPCGLVSMPLVRRMGRGEWQHRAWAAKVLGENGCTATAPELRRRLATERDARVRRQLVTALESLGAEAAG